MKLPSILTPTKKKVLKSLIITLILFTVSFLIWATSNPNDAFSPLPSTHTWFTLYILNPPYYFLTYLETDTIFNEYFFDSIFPGLSGILQLISLFLEFLYVYILVSLYY